MRLLFPGAGITNLDGQTTDSQAVFQSVSANPQNVFQSCCDLPKRQVKLTDKDCFFLTDSRSEILSQRGMCLITAAVSFRTSAPIVAWLLSKLTALARCMAHGRGPVVTDPMAGRPSSRSLAPIPPTGFPSTRAIPSARSSRARPGGCWDRWVESKRTGRLHAPLVEEMQQASPQLRRLARCSESRYPVCWS